MPLIIENIKALEKLHCHKCGEELKAVLCGFYVCNKCKKFYEKDLLNTETIEIKII